MPSAEQRSPSILLDSVQGWRIASSSGLHVTSDGALTLQPLPGEATLLADAGAIAEVGMTCPSGIASDGCGRLLAVDAGGGGVYIADLDADRDDGAGQFVLRRIDGVGGSGGAPRNFTAARGVAIHPAGGFLVADTGNGRVQAFAGAPHALTQVWQDLSGLRPATSESLPARLVLPWSVAADACGVVFVVDRGSRVVRRIDPWRRHLTDLGVGTLADPTRVAISADGTVAVADQGTRCVLLFRPDESMPFAEAQPPGQVPNSVAFGDDGTLYIGDEIGLIYVFVPERPEPAGSLAYRLVGSGDLRVTGRVIDLVWAGEFGLVALIEGVEDSGRGLWRIYPDGGFVENGHLVTTGIDSAINRCVCHRLILSADSRAGRGQRQSGAAAQTGVASLEVATYTSADVAGTEQLIAHDAVPWRTDLLSGDPNPDCLVQSEPGRFSGCASHSAATDACRLAFRRPAAVPAAQLPRVSAGHLPG